MKRIALVLALTTVGMTAFGQGLFDFNNRKSTSTPAIDAPVYLDVVGGTKLDGNAYLSAAYAAPYATAVAYVANPLAPVAGNLKLATNNTTGAGAVGFRTGTFAGYVNTLPANGGPFRLVGGVTAAAPDAMIQIMAWNASAGATFEEAWAKWVGGDASVKLGVSNPIKVATQTDLQSPSVPAMNPTPGLNPFAIVAVPEPSVIALGALGLLGALVIRRRK